MRLERLEPDRRRRRLQLLAELADVKALRDRKHRQGVCRERRRDLLALRRRSAV